MSRGISRERYCRSRRPAGVQRPSEQLPSFSARRAPIETNPRALSHLLTTAEPLVALEWAVMVGGLLYLQQMVRSAARSNRYIPRSRRRSWQLCQETPTIKTRDGPICGGRAVRENTNESYDTDTISYGSISFGCSHISGLIRCVPSSVDCYVYSELRNTWMLRSKGNASNECWLC